MKFKFVAQVVAIPGQEWYGETFVINYMPAVFFGLVDEPAQFYIPNSSGGLIGTGSDELPKYRYADLGENCPTADPGKVWAWATIQIQKMVNRVKQGLPPIADEEDEEDEDGEVEYAD